jgi:hypothetical protein
MRGHTSSRVAHFLARCTTSLRIARGSVGDEPLDDLVRIGHSVSPCSAKGGNLGTGRGFRLIM